MGSDEKFEVMSAKDRALMLADEVSCWLNPAKFEQTQRIAQMLAKSTFLPREFQGNVGNCMIAMDLADRMRMHPIMMMQSMYVVHGRPGFEGKFMAALVNNSGRYTDPLEYEWQGKPGKPNSHPGWGCRAFGTRKKTGKVVYGPWVTWEMVLGEGWNKPKGYGEKAQTSKWVTMPEMMFMYRAASYFVNVNDSDLKMGMQSVEEIEDTTVSLVRAPDGQYTTGEQKKDKSLYDVTEATPTNEKPKPEEKGQEDPPPETENPPEPQDDPPVYDGPWKQEAWHRLKGPGMMAFVDMHAPTFSEAPDVIREAFHAKYLVCKGIDKPWPFDDDGHFFEPTPVELDEQLESYGEPAERQQAISNTEEVNLPDGIDLETMNKFNEIWTDGDRDAIKFASEMIGNYGSRPTPEQIIPWLKFHDAFLEKEAAKVQVGSSGTEQPPIFEDEQF